MNRFSPLGKLQSTFANTGCYHYLTSRILAASRCGDYFGESNPINLSKRFCPLLRNDIKCCKECSDVNANLFEASKKTSLWVPDIATTWFCNQRERRLNPPQQPSLLEKCKCLGISTYKSPAVDCLRLACDKKKCIEANNYKRISPEFLQLLKKNDDAAKAAAVTVNEFRQSRVNATLNPPCTRYNPNHMNRSQNTGSKDLVGGDSNINSILKKKGGKRSEKFVGGGGSANNQVYELWSRLDGEKALLYPLTHPRPPKRKYSSYWYKGKIDEKPMSHERQEINEDEEQNEMDMSEEQQQSRVQNKPIRRSERYPPDGVGSNDQTDPRTNALQYAYWEQSKPGYRTELYRPRTCNGFHNLDKMATVPNKKVGHRYLSELRQRQKYGSEEANFCETESDNSNYNLSHSCDKKIIQCSSYQRCESPDKRKYHSKYDNCDKAYSRSDSASRRRVTKAKSHDTYISTTQTDDEYSDDDERAPARKMKSMDFHCNPTSYEQCKPKQNVAHAKRCCPREVYMGPPTYQDHKKFTTSAPNYLSHDEQRNFYFKMMERPTVMHSRNHRGSSRHSSRSAGGSRSPSPHPLYYANNDYGRRGQLRPDDEEHFFYPKRCTRTRSSYDDDDHECCRSPFADPKKQYRPRLSRADYEYEPTYSNRSSSSPIFSANYKGGFAESASRMSSARMVSSSARSRMPPQSSQRTPAPEASRTATRAVTRASRSHSAEKKWHRRENSMSAQDCNFMVNMQPTHRIVLDPPESRNKLLTRMRNCNSPEYILGQPSKKYDDHF